MKLVKKMRKYQTLFTVVLITATVFFTSCGDEDVSIPKPTPVITNVTICSDEAYTWKFNEITYNGSKGTQKIFIEGESDEADQTLNITVTPEPTPVVTDIAICSDDTYTWEVNTVTYNGSAGAQSVFVEGENCEADQTLNITVSSEPTPVVTDVTICSDETYTWEVNTITYDGSAGSQTVFIEGADCVADHTLNITVASEPTAVTTDVTVCSDENYTWAVNATTYNGSAGTQTVIIEGADCSADQTLNITVTPEPTAITTDVTICSDENYTWAVNATTYNGSAGTQTIFVEGVDCVADQIMNITVTQKPTAIVTDVTISANESYVWAVNSKTYNGSVGTQTVSIEGENCSVDHILNIIVTVAIGDFVYGGVVFYIDPTDNTKGLVCAVSDQSNHVGASWGSNTPTIGNVATAIGTGQANTNAILAVHTQGNNAAKLCNSYTKNGFSNWYLPSKDELNEVYNNKAIIQATSATNGGANFKNSAYWTSSEQDTDGTRALNQFFNYGSQNSNQKAAIFHVRAIRTF